MERGSGRGYRKGDEVGKRSHREVEGEVGKRGHREVEGEVRKRGYRERKGERGGGRGHGWEPF